MTKLYFIVIPIMIMIGGGGLFLLYKLYQRPSVSLPETDRTRPKVVFFGDSHFHGRIGIDIVTLLQKESPQLEIINLGHNGDTSENLIGKIDKILKLSPEQIYLLVGSNDVLKERCCNLGVADFELNYAKIVKSLKRIGNVFVLSIPMMGDDESDAINRRIKEFNQRVANISATEGVKYVPLFEKMAAYMKALRPNKKEYDHPHFSRSIVIGMRRYLLGEDLDKINLDYGFGLTIDGLHLNQKGGQILQSLIIPELPVQ